MQEHFTDFGARNYLLNQRQRCFQNISVYSSIMHKKHIFLNVSLYLEEHLARVYSRQCRQEKDAEFPGLHPLQVHPMWRPGEGGLPSPGDTSGTKVTLFLTARSHHAGQHPFLLVMSRFRVLSSLLCNHNPPLLIFQSKHSFFNIGIFWARPTVI